jgi:pyruvate/2-oxoglutarate dehydrogenase complex dihydrolipoamide dehydrogenase (E3) component
LPKIPKSNGRASLDRASYLILISSESKKTQAIFPKNFVIAAGSSNRFMPAGKAPNPPIS